MLGDAVTCTDSRLCIENGTATNSNGFILLADFTFLTLPQGARWLSKLHVRDNIKLTLILALTGAAIIKKYLIRLSPSCQPCLEVKGASNWHLPQCQELEVLHRCHHPSPSPPPLSLHRCQEGEGEEVEVVSLGVEAEVAGSPKGEVGCQEEEVEMGTTWMRHWAEEVLLGQRWQKVSILFLSIFFLFFFLS